METRKKAIVAIGSVAVVLALAIGGTLAYLQDTTELVSNTFEKSNLSVKLVETTPSDGFKIVPGKTAKKDPKVVVTNDIDCYAFVEVFDETEKLVTYAIADGWEQVGTTNVYGRKVTASDTTQEFPVLQGNQVKYDEKITVGDMGDVTTPAKLSFRAYVIQAEKFDTMEAAKAGLVELPMATLTAIDKSDLPSAGIKDSVSTDDTAKPLDTAVEFKATQTLDEIKDKDYRDWAVDFAISFNQQVQGNKVHLFGNYANYGWLGDRLSVGGFETLQKNQSVKVMGEWFATAINKLPTDVKPGFSYIKYSEILDYVKDFKCGIRVDDPADGLQATLKLIMIDDENHTHVISTYTYDFPPQTTTP